MQPRSGILSIRVSKGLNRLSSAVRDSGLIYLRRSFGKNEIKSFLNTDNIWKPQLVRLVILIPIFHITLSYHELPLLTIIRLVLLAFNSIFARFYQAQPAFHQAEPHFTTFNRII